MSMSFTDRADAGRQLAAALSRLDLQDLLVLALPRGGVPVAAEVAAALGAPLDVVVSRKVGMPASPETGIGAVAEGGVEVADAWALRALGISERRFARLAARERDELERRRALYRPAGDLPLLDDRDVVLVDDGLATGVTAEAAVAAVRRLRARRVVLAVPVGSADAVRRLEAVADEVVCVLTPADFRAVGRWYDVFDQVPDDVVIEMLSRAGS